MASAAACLPVSLSAPTSFQSCEMIPNWRLATLPLSLLAMASAFTSPAANENGPVYLFVLAVGVLPWAQCGHTSEVEDG